MTRPREKGLGASTCVQLRQKRTDTFNSITSRPLVYNHPARMEPVSRVTRPNTDAVDGRSGDDAHGPNRACTICAYYISRSAATTTTTIIMITAAQRPVLPDDGSDSLMVEIRLIRTIKTRSGQAIYAETRSSPICPTPCIRQFERMITVSPQFLGDSLPGQRREEYPNP